LHGYAVSIYMQESGHVRFGQKKPVRWPKKDRIWIQTWKPGGL